MKLRKQKVIKTGLTVLELPATSSSNTPIIINQKKGDNTVSRERQLELYFYDKTIS